MSIQQIVYDALRGSAALSAYVEEAGSPSVHRIYPEAAPQTARFPLAVYRLIASAPVASQGGSSGLTRYLVQVDCYHASLVSAQAMAVAAAVVLFGNFSTYRGIKQDGRVIYDEESRVFAMSQDFAIWAA